MRAANPVLRTLDPFECIALLATQTVGRLAFAGPDGVDLEPIHFIWSNGWIYGRMGDGAKARALRANASVAFEIDEVSGLFEWRSVVVRGTLFLLSADDDGPLHGEWDHAVTLLARLVPGAFTPEDPWPDRSLVFGIKALHVTGRAATAS